jgi:hypothetical protein
MVLAVLHPAVYQCEHVSGFRDVCVANPKTEIRNWRRRTCPIRASDFGSLSDFAFRVSVLFILPAAPEMSRNSKVALIFPGEYLFSVHEENPTVAVSRRRVIRLFNRNRTVCLKLE